MIGQGNRQFVNTMSLKSDLQRIIWERGYISIDQVEAYCKEHRYKLSNAERRLRESESPIIEAVRERGYIIGYKPKRNAEIMKKVNAINATPAYKPVEVKTGKLF